MNKHRSCESYGLLLRPGCSKSHNLKRNFCHHVKLLLGSRTPGVFLGGTGAVGFFLM